MLNQLISSLAVITANNRFRIAVQLIIFALLVIAALVQPEAALAGPSWGNIGG